MTFDYEESAKKLITLLNGYLKSSIMNNQEHPILLRIAKDIQAHIDCLNLLGHKLPSLFRFEEGEGRRFYRSGEIIAEIEAVTAFIDKRDSSDFLSDIELSRIILTKLNAWNQRIQTIGRDRVQICSLEEVSVIFMQIPQEIQQLLDASLANPARAASPA